MYPSKILLFGEYTILLNSSAIAIPFRRFFGVWDFMGFKSDDYPIETFHSNMDLKDFLAYLKQVEVKKQLEYPLDIDKFENDLENHLYFKSNIPKGYGLGSSGALTAAIFDRYAKIRKGYGDILRLRNCMSRLESYFHGISSGIDPLVSYLNSPVLIKSNNNIESLISPIEKILQNYGFFLVVSQQNVKTNSLVNYFNDKCKSDVEYLNIIKNQYIPLNNECVNILTGLDNTKNFFFIIQNITRFQLVLFNEMIPGNLISLINYGLENRLFYLKLCGSGGGGYFMGFTEHKSETQIFLKENGYEFLFLEDNVP
jgi:mevalonate kinase